MDVQLGPSSQGQPGFYSRRDLGQGPNSGAAMGGPQAYAAAPYSWAPAQPTPPTAVSVVDDQQDATSSRKMRKRKADTQDNERLSKRLSLLNLEQNGRQKLYVPVESPQLQPSGGSSSSLPLGQIPEGDQMQLDESNKHKVYIYDLDAELAEDGSSEGESSSDEARLVFLPDIARHLRQQQSRIPPRVLANPDGQLAGMQLVLYDDAPRSLSVPEEQDGVRKAVAEARARLRSQRDRPAAGGGITSGGVADDAAADAAAAPSMDVEIPLQQDRRIPSGLRNLANDAVQPPYGMVGSTSYTVPATSYDPDAMDMDID
ncbi:hypothetical protein LQW54_005955 [Pestalotiopsis sp. IQ-011]